MGNALTNIPRLFRRAGRFIARYRAPIVKVLVCIAVVVLCAVPAVFVNNLIGYLPSIVAILGIVYSYLYTLVLRRALVFEELSDLRDCERCSTIDFTVRIKNRSFLLISRIEPCFYISNLFGGDDSLSTQTVSLVPFEEREFHFSARFDHIGTFSAGLKRIKVYDLLGLFSFQITNVKRYEVNVYPRVHKIDELRTTNALSNESEKMVAAIISDGMDYASAREYEIGDPMKTIHWKMSARLRTYMTKLFEVHVNPSVAILLDLHTLPYDDETKMGVFDAVVETGISADSFARSNDIASSLLYVNRNGQMRKKVIKSDADYRTLSKDLPVISSEEYAGMVEQMLQNETYGGRSANNLVVCTSSASSLLVTCANEAISQGKSILLFLVIPHLLPEEERKKLLKPLQALNTSAQYFIVEQAEDTSSLFIRRAS